MNKRLSLLTIVSALIVAIVGITIAYAALSTSLSITTSNITQNILTWNVGFQGSSATASVGGTSDTGRSCGTASITSTTVTVAATTLSKPDDSCTYALVIKNSGTIGAKLTGVTATSPTSTTCTNNGASLVCGNITYKLATSNTGSPVLATNSTIAAGESQNVYLIVSYTGSELNNSAVTQAGASFSLVYSQN